MTALAWVLKAALFFVLFAFALNNQGPVTLHFFFGTQWQGPVVLVVLAAFALGVAAGVLAMLPLWLRARHRRQPLLQPPSVSMAPPATQPPAV